MVRRIIDEIAMYLFLAGLPTWFLWAVSRDYPRRQRVWLTLLLMPPAIAGWTLLWELILGRPADRGVFERGLISFLVSFVVASTQVPALLCGAWTRPVRWGAWYLGSAAIVAIYVLQRWLRVPMSGDALVAWLDWALAALMVVHATYGPRPCWMAAHLGMAAVLPWAIARAFEVGG